MWSWHQFTGVGFGISSGGVVVSIEMKLGGIGLGEVALTSIEVKLAGMNSSELVLASIQVRWWYQLK